MQDLNSTSITPADPKLGGDWERWSHEMQRYDERTERVMNSPEYARKAIRNLFSECSSIAKNLMEWKKSAPTAEALLWVRLSRIFSLEDELWRLADIVGLVSQSGCRNIQASSHTLAAPDRRPVVQDKNDLCSSGLILLPIIDHTVIPLLEAQ
jgi:hypothetical protein